MCIRLFSEEDFNSRTEFTDPEIVRSNLAAVILRMASLNLGDIAAFPFLEMTDSRYINDGFQVLLELGAVEAVRKVFDDVLGTTMKIHYQLTAAEFSKGSSDGQILFIKKQKKVPVLRWVITILLIAFYSIFFVL